MSATTPVPAPPADGPGTPGDPCPKCGSTEPWGFGSWCPNCGYYPKLGTTVEIPDAPKGVAAMNEEKPVNWLTVVPSWAWLLIVGCVVLLVGSIGVSRMLPEQGPGRIVWTVVQILVGGLIAFMGQLFAYLHACAKTDKYGPLDIVMKPFEIWKATIVRLPWGAWRLDLLAWGLTLVISAMVFIGGIDYMGLFEPGEVAKKKKAPSIVHEVVDQAKKARDEGAESLEEAMNQFVGEGEAKDGEDKEKKDAKTGPTLDCVIFGYTYEDGQLALLLLAAVSKGDKYPRFVATITGEDMPEEDRRKLIQRLPSLARSQPIARTSLRAKWLEPKMMVRVSHKGFNRDRRLIHASYLEMLGDVEKPKAQPKKPAGL